MDEMLAVNSGGAIGIRAAKAPLIFKVTNPKIASGLRGVRAKLTVFRPFPRIKSQLPQIAGAISEPQQRPALQTLKPIAANDCVPPSCLYTPWIFARKNFQRQKKPLDADAVPVWTCARGVFGGAPARSDDERGWGWGLACSALDRGDALLSLSAPQSSASVAVPSMVGYS